MKRYAISIAAGLLVVLAIGSFLFFPFARTIDAQEAIGSIASDPSIDPSAFMRVAPRDLETENWSPI